MKRLVCVFFIFVTCAVPCFAAEWFEGGNLHRDKLSAWSMATDENQVATMATFIFATADRDALQAAGADQFKASAIDTAGCITTFFETGIFDKNMTVASAAVICLRDRQKQYPFLLSKKSEAQQNAAAPAAVQTTQNKQIDAKADLDARARASAERMALEPADNTPEARQKREEKSKQARAEIAANTTKVQPEISALLQELQAMRQDKAFWGAGFSGKQGADWKKRVEALRARMKEDGSIAIEVRTAPAALMGLALEWIHSKGAMTDMAKENLGDVQRAIDWKLEE